MTGVGIWDQRRRWLLACHGNDFSRKLQKKISYFALNVTIATLRLNITWKVLINCKILD